VHTNIAVFRKYPFIQFSQLLQNPGLQIGVREVHHRKLHEKIKGVRLIRMQIVSGALAASQTCSALESYAWSRSEKFNVSEIMSAQKDYGDNKIDEIIHTICGR
jgi:hypothetical protein